MKSVSLSSCSSRYRSMVSMASMRSSVVAGGVWGLFMPAFLGVVVGGVQAAVVARAGAGTFADGVGSAHAGYPTTMCCSRRRARTSSGGALPVIFMRVMVVSIQAFMRSAVKPWRSHSITVAMWARNSSSALTRSCRASISTGAGLGVFVAVVMVVSFLIVKGVG